MSDLHLQATLDAVISESLQDGRALQRRAQMSAERFQDLVWTNAAALQHLAGLSSLQRSFDNAGVEASYRGTHLKKGAEVDAQETVAEGQVYKGESVASLPQTQSQMSGVLLDLQEKVVAQADQLSRLIKSMGNTPPQSGGHAAEAPGGLK